MYARTATSLLTALLLSLGPAHAVAESPAQGDADDEVDARAESAKAKKKDLDFNDAGITWWSMKEGLAHAKKTDTPILLVAYATWCSACRASAVYFHDDELVRLSQRFVMIRVDVDVGADAVASLTPGETYVPRVVFLDASGAPRKDVLSGSGEYPHFYTGLGPLVATMKKALAK